MKPVKPVGVLVLASLMLVTLGVTPQRASAQTMQSTVKVKWGITGAKILFDKKETMKISVGAGGATTLAAALPPPFDIALAIVAAAAATQAGMAAIDGNCVGVRILPPLPFVPPAVPFTYKPTDKKIGRYCR